MIHLQSIAMKPKLTAIFLAVGLLPLLVGSWFWSIRASDALMEKNYDQLQTVNQIKKAQVETFFQAYKNNVGALVDTIKILRLEAFKKLKAVRDGRKVTVERYLKTIRHQIVTLSQQPVVVEAAKGFRNHIRTFRQDNALTDEALNTMRRDLYVYYMGTFNLEFQKRNRGTTAPVEHYFSTLDDDATALQYYYIQNNPMPLGAKHLFNRAPDRSEYSALHNRVHPVFQAYQKKFGYYDIFLISPDKGDILYSVAKELDFAMSLHDEALAGTNIARAFHLANEAKRGDDVVFVDFEPYWPSYMAPASFVASSIYDGHTKVGILLFQFPLDTLNAVMAERAGLGKTGETYLIGPDQRMRSDSFTEPKYHSVVNSFKYANRGKVTTQAARRVLSGATGAQVIRDYSDNPVLSAWTPIQMAGLDWGLIAEIDVAEAFVPIDEDGVSFLAKHAARFDYVDLLLINPDGYVFYAASDHVALRTNLINGRYAESRLGALFRNTLKRGTFTLADIAPRLSDANELAMFMAQPILHDGTVELVVALEVRPDLIDPIMQRREGMGLTGENYLVGRDAGVTGYRSNRVVKKGHIGQQRKGAYIERALRGESGADFTIGSAGQKELLRYDPLQIPGLNWAIMGTMDFKEVQAPIRALFWTILPAVFLISAVIVIISFLTARGIVQPLINLVHATRELSKGNWSIRVPVVGGDEISLVGSSFNRMAHTVEEQYWLKATLSKFPKFMQRSQTLEAFAEGLIIELVPLIHGGHGVFYLLDTKKQCYTLLGNFRHQEREGLTRSFAVGEGLVGRCAQERRIVVLEEIPEAYIRMGYGLGAAKPLTIIAVPVIHAEKVLAIIEIASFQPFTPIQRALLEELARMVGLSLTNLRHVRRTESLLEDARQQAEELAAQQEELRQTNETLEAQTRILQQSEEELKAQTEELRIINESLEEKSLYLERQKVHLLEQSQALKSASRYKSEFLANMSHELRTPLNSLLILAKCFADNEEKNLSKEQVKDAAIIYASGNALLKLINEILDLAKIEAGRVDLNLDRVDIASFANDMERQFRHVADDKQITLTVDIKAGLPKVIGTDKEKVTRIVRNLLSNACKFTHEGGVTLRFHQPPDGWKSRHKHASSKNAIAISVEDSGIGVPADKQKVIFEAFQQADGATSRQFGGTGLGLSISTELAALLGGEIVLHSLPNKGSTFTLCLPEHSEPSPRKKQRGQEEQKGPVRSATTTAATATHTATAVATQQHVDAAPAIAAIAETSSVGDDRQTITADDQVMLVIEDDLEFARIICQQAQQQGFKCLAAPTGEGGLALAAAHLPMGILLDLGLPDMDGWTVMDRLKDSHDTRHIPIHIISGMELHHNELLMGAIGHLTKPVSKEQINTVFKKLLHFKGSEIRNLLLVEDEPASQMATTKLIEGKDIAITIASSGAEALEQLHAHTFDCMILDLGLPDINGFDFLDRIANDASMVKPPVIIYSGKDLTREEYELLKRYTNSIVIKGVQSPERLLGEVVLFLHRMERTLPKEQRQLLHKAYDPEATLKDKTVLVVDDDMRNTYALARSLEHKGMHVTIAANGQKALDLLDQNTHFDVVLMDIMMPVMDGYQAIAKIRSQSRFWKLPIIALTAKAMPEDRKKCQEAGASDYLTKPVDMDRLSSMLRVWLYP